MSNIRPPPPAADTHNSWSNPLTRLTMELEKCNIEKSRQKEDYNKLMQDFNGLQVRALPCLLACTYLPGNSTSP